MLISDYKPLCDVGLPMKGRQLYMHSFQLSNPQMPAGYEDYLPIVTRLCAAAGAKRGMAHMTVDEKLVEAGCSQRRPGPHVDGCWMPSQQVWGHGGGQWKQQCVGLKRMPVIVAANAPGCRVWRGKFDGEPKSDGDLSHLDLGHAELLEKNRGYLLTPDCIHESIRHEIPLWRTFLRIALPVEFQYA